MTTILIVLAISLLALIGVLIYLAVETDKPSWVKWVCYGGIALCLICIIILVKRGRDKGRDKGNRREDEPGLPGLPRIPGFPSFPRSKRKSVMRDDINVDDPVPGVTLARVIEDDSLRWFPDIETLPDTSKPVRKNEVVMILAGDENTDDTGHVFVKVRAEGVEGFLQITNLNVLA